MPEGDPRSNLFAAGGCTWPTVPPYKYFLGSGDATGSFFFLNTTGLLFPVSQPAPNHDLCYWTGTGLPFPMLAAVIEKKVKPDRTGYTLTLTMTALGYPPNFIVVEQEMIVQKCNIDQAVGNHSWPYTWPGATGSTCTLYQVAFDETEPPGGWPPP